MSDATPEPPPTPAEARLLDVLAPLRDAPPPSDPPLAPVVARALRWQVGVRSAVRAGGMLAAAAVDAVSLLMGTGKERR
ncbi:MAG: hypothetical protein AVDCRST_MAG30-3877 [uncultured Solirubrobacteraceae bacterium]|uniref:Uncharacterized protein n=1 Tax=uncultured Solirubrobacteraceae bacterium TaxID=1162706 RepID=A0A6J4TUT0_9ACTN|nr:MAG: hypothetical protein AVDCRST_MAG30-3877 [uncultured Solirubrobacteraceae bacterium]